MPPGKCGDGQPTLPQVGNEALRIIGLLFGLERQAQDRSLPPEQLLAIRQTQSMPLLEELHQKLLRWKSQVLPKHPNQHRHRLLPEPMRIVAGLYP